MDITYIKIKKLFYPVTRSEAQRPNYTKSTTVTVVCVFFLNLPSFIIYIYIYFFSLNLLSFLDPT